MELTNQGSQPGSAAGLLACRGRFPRLPNPPGRRLAAAAAVSLAAAAHPWAAAALLAAVRPLGAAVPRLGAGFGSSSGTSFGNTGFGSGSSTGGSLFGGGTTTQGGLSNTGSGANAAVGSTSFLGAYYLNPLAQGLNITQTNIGKPLYTLTTTEGSTAAIRSTNQATSYYGAPLGIRRLPAYATILKIKDMPPPKPPMAVRADLQNMLCSVRTTRFQWTRFTS